MFEFHIGLKKKIFCPLRRCGEKHQPVMLL